MKILLFFLSIFSICSAQTPVDSIIKTETEKLTTKRVSDFFFVEKICVGCNSIPKIEKSDCDEDNSTLFLFWREGKSNFVQKISNCPSQKKKIAKEIIQSFIDNKTELENEEVKKYSTKPDSITDKMIYSFPVIISHSTFTKFYFYNTENKIVKKIDDFDLTNNPNEPNIYYNRNRSLRLVSLKKLCDEIINKY